MNHTLSKLFTDKKIFFLDGDGNLYLGKKRLPGSVDFLRLLFESGKYVYVCTNNSSKSPDTYFQFYASLGLSIPKSSILTSTLPAILYLKQQGLTRIYWVATDDVSAYLEREGFIFTEHQPEACVLTYDTSLTYHKLKQFCILLRSGCPYFVTHMDKVCPSEYGPLPDVGLFVDLIAGATDRFPDKVFGKPSIDMIMPILNQHHLTLEDAVMIGDRLYTDIALGQNNALSTVLNFSGETTPDMLAESDIQPDITITSLQEWVNAIG